VFRFRPAHNSMIWAVPAFGFVSTLIYRVLTTILIIYAQVSRALTKKFCVFCDARGKSGGDIRIFATMPLLLRWRASI
jgi:hypothetical protein